MTSDAEQPTNDPRSQLEQTEQPEPADQTDERQPENTVGWIGFGLGTAAFVVSLTTAWSGSFMLGVFGMALGAHGMVRAYRRRATNGRYALIGLALSIVTLGLAFFWSIQAEPCRPLQAEVTKWEACYAEHTGLF